MKFIHIADVHWGMIPDGDKPWSRERSFAIKDTLGKVIDKCTELQADCLFISGDLFHRQPLLRDLKEINYLFSTIPQVKVVMIAGNHDRIRPNSAVMSFSWAPNVTFLMDEELSSVWFPELNTQVWGFSYHTTEIRENRLDGITAPLDRRIHVLLGHGGDASHIPFSVNALDSSGFSYIALGHIHKPEILLPNKMAFSGSLEPLDKTETGPHGMFYGEIDPNSRQVISLEFVPLASTMYIPLVVHVTPKTSSAELSSRITREIQKRGIEHIYRFRIQGMRDPDIEFELDFLINRFKIVEISDESEPQYDFNQLYIEHSSDMIGFYIRALQKENMSPVEKKALYYGIHALLETKDERS